METGIIWTVLESEQYIEGLPRDVRCCSMFLPGVLCGSWIWLSYDVVDHSSWFTCGRHIAHAELRPALKIKQINASRWGSRWYKALQIRKLDVLPANLIINVIEIKVIGKPLTFDISLCFSVSRVILYLHFTMGCIPFSMGGWVHISH